MTSSGSEVVCVCVMTIILLYNNAIVSSSVIELIMLCYLNQTQCYTLEILSIVGTRAGTTERP